MNINVYLPDALGKRAKDAEIPFSQLLQQAVSDELDRRETVEKTLTETEEYLLDIEDDNGNIVTVRLTGTLVGEGRSHEDSVFLTDDERVIVWSADRLKYYELDDPVEELREWDLDDYAGTIIALGFKPIIDI